MVWVSCGLNGGFPGGYARGGEVEPSAEAIGLSKQVGELSLMNTTSAACSRCVYMLELSESSNRHGHTLH